MALQDQFETGSRYNFNVYGVAILGIQENVQILGVGSHEIAMAFNDVATLHVNVFSSLPDNSVQDDFRSYNYLIFKASNGTTYAYGLPWIDGASVEVVGDRSAVITIPSVSSDDVEIIRMALVSIGKTPSDITLK